MLSKDDYHNKKRGAHAVTTVPMKYCVHSPQFTLFQLAKSANITLLKPWADHPFYVNQFLLLIS